MKRLMDHVGYCTQVKTSGDGPAFELTNVSQLRTLARVCTRNGLLALSSRLILIIIASQVGSLNSVAQHTYTSPIDITGLKVQLHAVVPDRNSGNPTDVALPVGFLGPQMNQLFATPLSAQFDQYWSSTRDLKTGLTQREQICNKIKDEVNTRAGGLGKGISPYDFVCELAPTGKLLAHQVGSTMDIGYLLTNNKVSIALTTPATCHAGHGTPLCPNDPRLIITFAAEITTVIRTPDLCRLSTEPVTALLQAVHVDTGGVANVAKLGDELIFGDKHFAALEQAIQSWEQQKPSPLAGAFNEMRNSGACTGRNPALRIALGAFRTFETLIQPPQGIILRTTHVGIPAPQVDAPNPGASATASQPTFTHPMISTSRPSVAAGTAVQISGQYFPLNPSLTNAVPITLLH
ncbi:MAG TPA: hypothetical protein VE133_10555, partial [Candidatus Sulfotelmatobacter sp.]|nr:hypothetical protein [Candidatus Sulfotelmatobacter sp.]